ncbi:hypothetical protein NIES2100_08090 [Calothrix sp. NIES-2100]|nr:hypothetical protein NIES2100_08090 [Calothrix sp. NIES-2100]
MLLAHNFDVSGDIVPALSREEFAQVFQSSLSTYDNLQCRLVNHPHWTVEILFPTNEFSPQQVGELCAQALAEKRHKQQLNADTIPEILVLGGIKTTPPTSDSPDALQPGNWGVDVVETQSGEAFLQAIAWDATIAQKSADSVFKVERKPAQASNY